MRIHFIGGAVARGPLEDPPQGPNTLEIFRLLGKKVAEARHEAIVSSPFEGSIDVEILRGIAAGTSLRPGQGPPGTDAAGVRISCTSPGKPTHFLIRCGLGRHASSSSGARKTQVR